MSVLAGVSFTTSRGWEVLSQYNFFSNLFRASCSAEIDRKHKSKSDRDGPQTRWLKTSGKYPLPVLEARDLNQGVGRATLFLKRPGEDPSSPLQFLVVAGTLWLRDASLPPLLQSSSVSTSAPLFSLLIRIPLMGSVLCSVA